MFTAKEKVQIGKMKVQDPTIFVSMLLTSNCIFENLTFPFSWLLIKNENYFILQRCSFCIPSLKMTTLRNRRKLATINRATHEEHPWTDQARNTNVLRNQDGYITQVSEEIEGRLTNKLSKEFI